MSAGGVRPVPRQSPLSLANEGLVLPAIVQERARQDQQWGGPEHDRQHTPIDWWHLLAHQMEVAEHHAQQYVAHSDPFVRAYELDKFRERLVEMAALCVAALEHGRG